MMKMNDLLCGNCLEHAVSRSSETKVAYSYAVYSCSECGAEARFKVSREVTLHPRYGAQPCQVEAMLLGPRPKREDNFTGLRELATKETKEQRRVRDKATRRRHREARENNAD